MEKILPLFPSGKIVDFTFATYAEGCSDVLIDGKLVHMPFFYCTHHGIFTNEPCVHCNEVGYAGRYSPPARPKNDVFYEQKAIDFVGKYSVPPHNDELTYYYQVIRKRSRRRSLWIVTACTVTGALGLWIAKKKP